MSDKELLELAAKACGFGNEFGVAWTEAEYPRNSGRRGALWNGFGHEETAQLWNPLTDDGDALRLAVKLGFNLFLSYPSGVDAVIGTGVLTCNELPPNYWSAHNGDPYAATRRAIVRAAAEIGRTK